MRNSYPIYFKWAYAKNQEKLIPAHIRKGIPKQTKSVWRQLSNEEIKKIENDPYAKSEFKSIISEYGIDKIQNLRMTRAMTKFHLMLCNILGKDDYYKMLSNHKTELVQLVEHYKVYFDKKQILKWLKVAPPKYEAWLTQSKYSCDSSIISLCAKQYTNQTTEREFKIIKDALNDERYLHWPKSAIHAKLVRDEKLFLSRSTFYKVANYIKPGRKKKNSYKKIREKLIAKRINEYWHLDISHFRTDNGEKNFIYAIIDRFSRKILAYSVRKKISSKYASEVLLEALGVDKPTALKIISDGGPENKGKHIRIVLEEYKLNNNISEITHKIALKDIDMSNNSIERFFAIMKGDYLYTTAIENMEELIIIVDRLVYEYNLVRPHHMHGILTPHEVHIGKEYPNLKNKIHLEKTKRVEFNRNCSCNVCTCDK